MDALWTPRNITSLDGLSHQFHKIFFRISKCLGCNGEKSLEDKKKEWI